MNRTWKLMQELREVYKNVYLEANVREIHGNTTHYFSLELPHPYFLIKTVRVVPVRKANVELVIYNNEDINEAEMLYFNDAEYSTGNFEDGIYDMVDIPYSDESGNGKIYFKITNKGLDPNNYLVIVTGLTTRE